jgi:hypothetical protein
MWFRGRGVRIADGLDLPDPFDLAELCRRAGEARDRPIVLVPMAIAALGVSGLWLASNDVDYIWYEQNTSAPHREHVILHELGHILCGHEQSESATDVLAALFPQLDPAVVRLMLARRHETYGSREEVEAETFAYQLLARVDRMARPPGGDDPTGRLGRALED